MPFVKRAFKKCGKNVVIGRNFSINSKNATIGNNSSIGANGTIMCTMAPVSIGNNVMIAQNLLIVTGKHRYNIVGRYMNSIKDNEKEQEDDMPVTIEDDVWIASNVTILKGVTIGCGSIIGAGSIVTKNVGAYEIVCGVPAKKIAMRFTEKEIAEHEKILLTSK
jgi:acetyltransferase-like isoleucine patch superfamily enzyme